jgi:hypothetical protein
MTTFRMSLLVGGVALALSSLHCGSTASEPSIDGGHDGGHEPNKSDSGKGDSSHPSSDGGKHVDGSPSCTPSVPAAHRPTAVACQTTRPPSASGSDAAIPDSGFPGQCDSDSQCTAGKNGRCQQIGGDIAGMSCNYDECATDAECGTDKVCECGTSLGSDGRSANTCIPANCQTDSDCGQGGYCSPSEPTSCGNLFGVAGYFCHKVADECTVDECTVDSDCQGHDAGPSSGGYCAWDPTHSKWTCEYGVCTG